MEKSGISKFLRYSCAAMLAMALVGVGLPALADDAGGDAGGAPLTGDWGGLRKKMQDNGIDLNATETLDLMGNPTGGVARRATLQGNFAPTLDIDFDKLAKLQGLTAHISAFQIHGHGMSTANLNNNITTSTGIEADPATRLFEAWVQKDFDGGNVSIRAGQMASDIEFITSQYGGLFINSVYGWPSSLATNLPGGGPGYPLATPGVRLRLGQTDPWSWQIAVFDGDPSGGPGGNTDQRRNASGTAFPLDHGAFIMTEAAYARKGDGVDLPGTYKLGFWYHTGNFDDPRYDKNGLSLADPASNGKARTYHNNYGFYGVIDQMLWHPKGAPDKGLAGFMRALWNPGDRNTIAYQIDAGVNLLGMIPGRPDDVVGVAGSYLPFTDAAIGYDRDTNLYNGTNAPVRNYEAQLEVTYQAPVTPWLTLQPDFQYIFHPGGNVANPYVLGGTVPVNDAAIFGLRAVVTF